MVGLPGCMEGRFFWLSLVNKALTHEVKGLALKYRASVRRAEAAGDLQTLLIASQNTATWAAPTLAIHGAPAGPAQALLHSGHI